MRRPIATALACLAVALSAAASDGGWQAKVDPWVLGEAAAAYVLEGQRFEHAAVPLLARGYDSVRRLVMSEIGE